MLEAVKLGINRKNFIVIAEVGSGVKSVVCIGVNA